jgi:hypothetical protein
MSGFMKSPLAKQMRRWRWLDEQDKLLPCPFCGNDDCYSMPCDPEPSAEVRCGGRCGAIIYSRLGRDHAVRNWNTRAK